MLKQTYDPPVIVDSDIARISHKIGSFTLGRPLHGLVHGPVG